MSERAIVKRSVRNTDLELSELSFGCGAIGGLYRAVDTLAAFSVLQAAWDAGIRYFDVAPFYGHGKAERRVGDFLHDKDSDSYVLSTKVGKLLKPVASSDILDFNFVDPLPFSVEYDYSYAGIMRSYEDSLQRLGLSKIDILFVHDLEPCGFTPDDYQRHLDVFLSEGIKALQDLKAQGRIKAFGLGVNQVEACMDVLRVAALDLLLLAGRYTLLDRSAEPDLLGLCQTKGVGIVIGGVFNSGILATGPIDGAQFDYAPATQDVKDQVGALQALCAKHDTSLAAASLKFPLHHPAVVSVLIGTAKVSSLDRNISDYRVDIPRTLMTLLADPLNIG